MLHAPGTKRRTILYGLLTIAGIWSALFPSHTLDEPLHYLAVLIWAAVLTIGAGISCVASIAGRFRVEYVSIIPVLAGILMYDVALWWWTTGASRTDLHAQLSSGGAAMIVLSLGVLVAGRLKDLHRLVRETA